MASSGSLTAALSPKEAPDADSSVPRGPRVSAASSWECRAGLASVLRLVPEDEELGAGELLGPPQNGENIVVLEGCLNNENIAPCFLYLHCDPHGSEEITSLGIVSEARNMEIYVGDEYCATSRGQKVIAIGSKNDQVILYKKYLKLECPTTSCKIKLLSIREKNRVILSRILVKVSTKPVPDFSVLGSGIDLDRVQAIMESMGSKLSPGAQQLLDMVHFQQKNDLPFGSKLLNIFGRKGVVFRNNHSVEEFQKASDFGSLNHLPNGPPSPKPGSTVEKVLQDLKTSTNINKQKPGTGNVFEPPWGLTSQHNTMLFQNDFKGLVSSFLQEQTNENSNTPSSTFLLPFLQTVCGQVNRLRIDEKNEHYENSSETTTEDDADQTIRMEQPPICHYVEDIISKQMELVEKRLTDYIDLRMQKLQEYLDTKVVTIMGLVQNSKIITEVHDPSKEGNSRGNT